MGHRVDGVGERLPLCRLGHTERQQRLGGALDVHPQRSAVAERARVVESGHQPTAGVEGEQCHALCVAFGRVDPQAPGSGHVEQCELRRVTRAGDGVGGGAVGDGVGEVVPRGGEDGAAGVADLLHVHHVRGQGARLVGADDGHGTECLRRGEPFHQRSAPGHRSDPRGQREGDRRQQAFRYVRHQQPDGEHEGLGPAQPGVDPERQKRDPHTHRDGGD